ncbi:unnamed protein product [Diamesa hyperborea]
MNEIKEILDRIELQEIAQNHNYDNEFKEVLDNYKVETLVWSLKLHNDEYQQIEAATNLIEEEDFDLVVLFNLITKNFHDGTHKDLSVLLIAVTMESLKSSLILWRKILQIIMKQDSSTNAFNDMLMIKQFNNAFCNFIDSYLKTVVQLDENEFTVSTRNLPESKANLFSSISLSEVFVIINHLLEAPPDISNQFTKQLFNDFQLSESFLTYMKSVLRNI